MALIGNNITEKCQNSDQKIVRQCQIDPITGPHWATTSRCPKKPTYPGKDKLKGLEKVQNKFIDRLH